VSKRGFWQRRIDDGVQSAAEALFPENTLGVPDWKQTQMVPRMLGHMEILSISARRLVVLLFLFVELATPLLSLRFRRFSRLRPSFRRSLVRRWSASSFYWLRVVGDSLKASMSMIYLSHPDVLQHMGWKKVCHNPQDTLQPEIVPPLTEEASA